MKKRIIAALMSASLMLSGCTVAGKDVYVSLVSPFTVFSMDKLSCSPSEAKLYLANYKNIYGRVGETYIFSEGFHSSDMEEGFKEAALNHLTKVFSLNVYAKDHNIELDEKEEKKVKAAAKDYYSSLNKAEKSYTGASMSDVLECYTHYALAKKVNERLMSSVDNEVSEDEARIMDAYVVYVKDEKAFNKVKKEIKKGTDFGRIAATYSKEDKGEVSFGRGKYPSVVEEAAFSLENGEVSEGIVYEDGYYFIKCINKYNEKLSEKNKETIISNNKKELLKGIIDEQKKNGYSQLNVRLWEDLHMVSDDEITTDTLFVTIDQAMR